MQVTWSIFPSLSHLFSPTLFLSLHVSVCVHARVFVGPEYPFLSLCIIPCSQHPPSVLDAEIKFWRMSRKTEPVGELPCRRMRTRSFRFCFGEKHSRELQHKRYCLLPPLAWEFPWNASSHVLLPRQCQQVGRGSPVTHQQRVLKRGDHSAALPAIASGSSVCGKIRRSKHSSFSHSTHSCFSQHHSSSSFKHVTWCCSVVGIASWMFLLQSFYDIKHSHGGFFFLTQKQREGR